MWALIEEDESIFHVWSFSSSLDCTELEKFEFLIQISENEWPENPSIYRYSWSSCEEPRNKIPPLFFTRKESTIFRLYIRVKEQ